MTNQNTKTNNNKMNSSSMQRKVAANITGKSRVDPNIKVQNSHRRVSKAPDMSKPVSRSRSASVSIGNVSVNNNNKKNNTSVIKSGFLPMLLPRNEEKIVTVKAIHKKPFPTTTVILALICTVLFMFMIVSYVQINEYTIEIASMRSELSSLIVKEKDLSLGLEKKNDMLKIEEYATENLGMVKIDQLTKKHISMDQEDKIEVVEPEPTHDATVVTTVMSAIAQNFEGFWEYIK